MYLPIMVKKLTEKFTKRSKKKVFLMFRSLKNQRNIMSIFQTTGTLLKVTKNV